MKEEWKSASMRHGEQSVITLIDMATGINLKLMLFVNRWDIQQQVHNNIIINCYHNSIQS